MTGEVFAVKPDDYVFEAVRLMGDKQVRRIPVVTENGELAGIIAMADVALEMEDEREIAETLEEISSGASFWSKQ
jgi:signal-transduction protein with cAMP-binding, CBS, and nucleotidyltransferase domain